MFGGDFAKDFNLNELVIESVTGTQWDITLLMTELNIYEDIFNVTLTMDIVVDDADNRIKNFPITGHEWIRVRFSTPGKSEVKLRFRIYKISSRELEKDRRQTYIIHCISDEAYTNAQKRVSKAYKNWLISDIVDNVQTEYLNSSFSILETTKYLHHIIPGYWTPFHTINMAAARANSAAFQGSNYVYFQNADGFNFCSLELLCSQQAKLRYILQPANIRNQDVALGYKPRTLDVDEVAVQSYRFHNNFDVLENVSNGMYHSRLLWHDIERKKFDDTDWDYPGSYTSYTHVEPNSVQGGLSYLWTNQSNCNGTFGAHKFYPLGQTEQPNWVQSWLLQRTSQMQQIQNVVIDCTVPGDSDRRAGDIVEFWLPSPEPLVENQLQMEKYYMGRYLVSGLKHTFHKSQYQTILELVKDSVFTAYP